MAETNLKKNKQGYGYKYTELAQINEYLESKGISYYQIIKSEPFGDVEHPVYQDQKSASTVHHLLFPENMKP